MHRVGCDRSTPFPVAAWRSGQKTAVVNHQQVQPDFDEAQARSALKEAAGLNGLLCEPAVLISPVADNAVFRLPGGIVARVSSTAGTLPRATRDVAIGRWLNSDGFPAVAPVTTVEQPVVRLGRVVTFWHEVPGAAMASTRELGSLLRVLHSMKPPPQLDVGRLEPFVRLDDHLAAAAPYLPALDAVFLAERLSELRTEYTRLRFVRPPGPIHGDANRKNAVRGSDGRAVLLDLERFSIGPPEWDLAVPAVYRRLGWYTAAEYDDFVDAYGWDVREWDGLPVLVAIRELRMTAWLSARVGREPRLLAEAEKRIASLRDPNAPGEWTPGE
jgi:hypothetical protein